MGTFLSLTAVHSADSKTVLGEALAWARSQGWRVLQSEPSNYEDWILEHPPHEKWSFLEFKWSSLDWDALTQILSRQLETAAFFFMIYDGDLWGYHFFDIGQPRGKFISCPSRFPDLEDKSENEVKMEWNGGIPEIVRRLNFMPEKARELERYARHLSDMNGSYGKANPNDEHTLEDPWVVADFMRCLGIPFPKGETVSTHYLLR
jgi:hypothetical protein